MAAKAEPKDRRQEDRAAELEKQAAVDKAMEKFLADNAAEAAQVLRDQQEYELTGIRKVVGKP